MTVSLEKIFFTYILNNRKYFDIVEPSFFKNAEIQFVYKVIRKYILGDVNIEIPHPKQILEMVSIEDKDGLITKEILKSILTTDISDYDEKEFILKKIKTWILINKIKLGSVDIIDETRNLDTLGDYDTVIESANRIKMIADKISNDGLHDDEELGSDFDDAENHVQDSSRFKIKSGFNTIDHMLGGGWDVGTLNVIMASTNNGKCTFSDTIVTIRNKKNNNIYTDKIGSIFSKISRGHNNI